MKDKGKELLGAGLEPVVVASALGVTQSLVSQWLSDENFAADVQKLKLVNFTAATARDRKWNSLEDSLLEKLESLLPFLTNPHIVLQALRTVNGATRRSAPKEQEPIANQTHVHLHMPQLIAAKFVVNPQNQVIEVDGRSMATMPASTVVKMAEAQTQKAEEQKRLPVPEVQDLERARERVATLTKLSHHTVHEVSPLCEQL